MDAEHLDDRQAAALLRSEAMLRNAQRIAGIGSWEVNLIDGRMIWSDGVFPIFGIDPGRFGGTYAEYRALIHPDDRARVSEAAAANRRRSEGAALDLEYRIVRPNGEVRIVLERGEVRFDGTGRPVSAAGVVFDVTESKRTELALARSGRALRMLSRCNEALVRAEDERTLLDEICRIVVDVGGYRMTSVLYARDDAERALAPVAHAGYEAGYFSEVTVSWSGERPEGLGPAGRAVRSGRSVVIPDLAGDPDYAPWAQPALRRGYRSVVALPLKSRERIFGVFGLYSGELRSIPPEEVELLHELAEDLAFGIVSLRVKVERQLLMDTALAISDKISRSTGSAYFETLLKSLLNCLGAQAGFIAGNQREGEDRIEAICAVVDGEVLPNFRYGMRGTPCADVGDDEELVIERDVCGVYTQAPTLARLGAQAYVGRSLVDAAGERIGTMFVLFREPLRERALAVAMLRMFAARVAAEIVRQRDESRLRDQALLLDKAQDAITVRTLDHRVLYWYQGAERVFGWTAREVVNRSVLEFKIVDEAQFREAMACVLRDGEWLGEIEEKRADGSRIVVECRWTLVRGDDGEPQSVLAIETDVTERKRAEARLAESEARAAHAQKLESIGQLTGGIAHDFNNLLTVIIGNSEQLSRDLRDRPELASMAQMVRMAGERGAELTSRLLAFARRQALEPTIVEPPKIVEGMLELLRRTLGEHIVVEAALDAQTWPADVDPNQLEHAILNLCINARDAMPNGGRLILETSNAVLDQDYAASDFEVVPGEYAMIAVTDTGTGIAAEHLPRVFEPFFTTKPAGKGTGLGLSMVYGFTKQSGGTVKIYSELGAGTVVKLYLPRAHTARTGGPAPEAFAPATEARGAEVVLLVEDNELVRQHAARLLGELGYRVIAAADGTEAMVIARSDQPIDLLFTDVMMPGGIDGPQLAERVRRLRPNLPVLYTSGYTENAIVHHARVDAGTMLLHKPYDRRTLAEKVRQALASTSGRS